jgi:hypothetical protein
MPKTTAKSKATGKKWMQKAVKRPGALSAKAKRAGMSVQAYAQKHKHDSGVVSGEEALRGDREKSGQEA